MGNACSCCRDSGCMEWLFPKKPNLPSNPEPVDLPKPVTPIYNEGAVEFEKEYLAVKSFDLAIAKNSTEHHAAEYELVERAEPRLVVRRGQEFTIILQTNRLYDAEKDKLSLVFTVADAKKPNFGNGTQVGVGIDMESPSGWKTKLVCADENSLTVQVMTSPKAIIGKWNLDVDIQSADTIHNYPCKDGFYLLFNPWCKDDAVYMESDEEKQEYVLNDFGMIWRGTTTRSRPCPWNFAQFEENVLECVLEVLTTVCKMSPANRADAVNVSRAISAGVNSPDDAGVLVGNWSDDYSGGTSPVKWAGSQLIFQEFYKTKKSVKYGQCWVFSGVVTTACRALGIPCRPITNFESAHDTHNSLTIDYFFDDEGKVMEELNSDSVWNFHVWNEVWMTREDIGSEYNGWQVIDATPQEESDGQYRCGPAPLAAIKKGEIKRPYDVPFVFAEVNADKLFWKYRGPCQPMKLLGKKTGGIGNFISTKAVGKHAREDVTHQYKFAEDSREERDVMRNALRMCENTFARYYLNEDLEDIEFDFQMNDDIVIGQPFTVTVIIENKSDKDYDVEVVLRSDTMRYTGAVKDLVKKHKQDVAMKAHSKERIAMEVTFAEYYEKLVTQCAFNLACLCKVKQTEFEYFAQDDFRVRKPDIKIECPGELTVKREAKCRASFKNPLPIALTKGRFMIQGGGLTKVQFINLKEAVPVGGEAACDFTITPTIKGEKSISIIFDSRQLEDVDGMLTVQVSPALEPETVPATNGTDHPVNGDAATTTLPEVSPEEEVTEEA